MYQEKTKTITLDKTHILFYGVSDIDTEFSMLPKDTTLVEDIADPCGSKTNPYLPDYVARGYFKFDPNGSSKPRIFLEEEGTHFVYFTSMPKDVSEAEKAKYRLLDTEWVSYWEDTTYGYLFQVMSRDKVLKAMLNIMNN